MHHTGTGSASRRGAEGDALASVLGDGALGGDANAAAGGDHRQPVVDVGGVLDRRFRPGRPGPQVGGGGAGAPVDGDGALPDVLEGEERRRAQGSSAARAQ
jgi:hypothetical protein